MVKQQQKLKSDSNFLNKSTEDTSTKDYAGPLTVVNGNGVTETNY